jgi:hypothetical protein
MLIAKTTAQASELVVGKTVTFHFDLERVFSRWLRSRDGAE